jgi:hypothetical protein
MENQCPPRITKKCVTCNSSKLSKSPAILMPFIAERVFGWIPTEITAEWGLRDIKSGQAYSICNTLKCDDCGLIFLDIRFDDSEMAALYSGYRGDEYNKLRDKYEPGYTANNEWRNEKGFAHISTVETYISSHIALPTKILDWGGDTGINTPFKGKVATHHIFDISDKQVIDGAKRVSVTEAQESNYDLITLMHVLEHIPYPQNTLNEIAGVMGKGTALYIELPHEEIIRLNPDLCNSPYRQKRHWHEHINFYTEQSIISLLKSCGLKRIDLSTLKLSSQVTSNKEGHIYSALCCLDQ